MIKRLIAAVAVLCAVSGAQTTVTPIVQPRVNFLNAIGGPCVGCQLFTYTAGTTTQQATYLDSTGTSLNTNPIILDASGGAFIWVGRSAYKFVLKDPLGSTLWTVDNVNEGNLFPCGPAGSVQIANTGVTGADCDSAITINKANHTLNVGTIGANHVVIGALGTPSLWTFDTSTPATALASLGGGTVNAGTANQLAYYAGAGTTISGTSAIPSNITATTQSPSDNSTKLATTAYVQTPGIINPTSVKIASGVAMTDNQGNGIKVQHSTGTTTTGDSAMFDANGNVVDSGVPISGTTLLQSASASGCITGTSSYNTCTTTITWPIAFADTNYQVACTGIGVLTDSSGSIGRTKLVGTTSKTTTSVTVATGNDGTASNVGFASIDCIARHP